jgi:hypothetical protein
LFTAASIFERVGEILQYLFQLGGLARENTWLFDSPSPSSWWWGTPSDYRL